MRMGTDYSGGGLFLTGPERIYGKTGHILEATYGEMERDGAAPLLLGALREVIDSRQGKESAQRARTEEGHYLYGVHAGYGPRPSAPVKSVLYAEGIRKPGDPAFSAVEIAFWVRGARDMDRRREWNDDVAELMDLGFANHDEPLSHPEDSVPVVGDTVITTDRGHAGFPRDGFRFRDMDNYLAVGRIGVPPAIQNLIAETVAQNLTWT